ncbi:hypothetical protein [uncultured Paracoccus sp.]|uniref:hypothetical protein n=1 Tax=uncultured Paracoccus sp. TaxID=189685 RepID=UPI0025D28773|nr:hypothetical protein [uncultured Paracoccus sp.]
MDRFLGDLSYCLRLLIGFDAVEADHGGRLPAMGGVGLCLGCAKLTPSPAPARADGGVVRDV